MVIMPKRKLTKSERYQLALKKHIKYLRSLGLNVDDNGRIILTQPDRGFYLDVASRTFDTGLYLSSRATVFCIGS